MHKFLPAAAPALPRRQRTRLIAYSVVSVWALIGCGEEVLRVVVRDDARALLTAVDTVAALRLPATPPAAVAGAPAPAAPNRAEVLTLFWTGDFAELQRRFDEQQHGLQTSTVTAADQAQHEMVRTIASAPYAYHVAQRWRDSSPAAYWPRVVLGYTYLDEAWRARGKKFAAETSEQQFTDMRRWLVKAADELRAAVALEARPLAAITGLMGVALLSGTRSQTEALASAAWHLSPHSQEVYSRFITAREPRWGGSLDDMQAVADAAQERGAPAGTVSYLAARTHLARHDQQRRVDHRSAPAIYRQAIEIADQSWTWNRYAWALYEMAQHEEALKAYARAIELEPDNVDARERRAWILKGMGRTREAFADWRQAAQAGHYSSQERLIRAYAYGDQGVPKDYDELRYWCELAAVQGNGWGDFCIGGMYFDGLAGYERNAAEAVRWFRLAALKGHPVAQHDYGWMLVQGRGVAADRAEGIRWLRAAARQDNEQAKNKLRGLGEPLGTSAAETVWTPRFEPWMPQAALILLAAALLVLVVLRARARRRQENALAEQREPPGAVGLPMGLEPCATRLSLTPDPSPADTGEGRFVPSVHGEMSEDDVARRA